jgi:cytochrome P450
MTTTPTGPAMTDPDLVTDPACGYGRLREQAPVVPGTAFDGTPVLFVTRHEDVRAVLGDDRFSTDPEAVPGSPATAQRDAMMEALGVPDDLVPYIARSILDVDGADHARLRKLVSRAFTVRRVGGLRPRVEETAAYFLDRLGPAADLIAEFAYPVPITVICELVGVPEEDRPAWRRWSAASKSFEPGVLAGAVGEAVGYTHALVERRRSEPADDLISDLVRAQAEDGDRLSDVELVTTVLALVTAGHETTANLIGNGALALLTHPDQLAALRADPAGWPGAVGELMRWCGPVQVGAPRFATADAEVAGQPVPAGTGVQVVLVSANRDPRAYPDPDRLDVTRRPSGRGEGHLGFGHGAHYCLGAALARQEGEVALRALFDRFPGIALDTDEPQWLPVPGIRHLRSLPVRLR